MSSNRPPNQPTLREEGIEARNFVSWRVPKTIPKDALESATKNEKSVNINSSATSVADSNNLSAFSSANYKEMTKYKLPSTSPHSNVSVASMRLWKLIFQNVCRSVDELYAFCEEEQNGELCEQSFQFFLSSCRDFAQLAQKYDKSDQNISLSEKANDERYSRVMERKKERESFLSKSPKSTDSFDVPVTVVQRSPTSQSNADSNHTSFSQVSRSSPLPPPSGKPPLPSLSPAASTVTPDVMPFIEITPLPPSIAATLAEQSLNKSEHRKSLRANATPFVPNFVKVPAAAAAVEGTSAADADTHIHVTESTNTTNNVEDLTGNINPSHVFTEENVTDNDAKDLSSSKAHTAATTSASATTASHAATGLSDHLTKPTASSANKVKPNKLKEVPAIPPAPPARRIPGLAAAVVVATPPATKKKSATKSLHTQATTAAEEIKATATDSAALDRSTDSIPKPSAEAVSTSKAATYRQAGSNVHASGSEAKSKRFSSSASSSTNAADAGEGMGFDTESDMDAITKEEVAKESEKVWAEAEAWIDAEVAVEEEAWEAILQRKTLEEILTSSNNQRTANSGSGTGGVQHHTLLSKVNDKRLCASPSYSASTAASSAAVATVGNKPTSAQSSSASTKASSSAAAVPSSKTMAAGVTWASVSASTLNKTAAAAVVAAVEEDESPLKRLMKYKPKPLLMVSTAVGSPSYLHPVPLATPKQALTELSEYDSKGHIMSSSIFLESELAKASPERHVRPKTPSTPERLKSRLLNILSGGGGGDTIDTANSQHDVNVIASSSTAVDGLSPSALELQRRHEARLFTADLNRDRTVEERRHKARIASHRVKVITEKKTLRLARAEQALEEKLNEAAKRHSEYVQAIKGRALNENTKVSEVMFLNTLNEENLAYELQQRLEEVEARILAAANRRNERLNDISVQQRKRNHKKSQQMSDLRHHLEQQKMERWEKLQMRLETVQKRRDARLLEMSTRSVMTSSSASAVGSTGPPTSVTNRTSRRSSRDLYPMESSEGNSTASVNVTVSVNVNNTPAAEVTTTDLNGLIEIASKVASENKQVKCSSNSGGSGSGSSSELEVKPFVSSTKNKKANSTFESKLTADKTSSRGANSDSSPLESILEVDSAGVAAADVTADRSCSPSGITADASKAKRKKKLTQAQKLLKQRATQDAGQPLPADELLTSASSSSPAAAASASATILPHSKVSDGHQQQQQHLLTASQQIWQRAYMTYAKVISASTDVVEARSAAVRSDAVALTRLWTALRASPVASTQPHSSSAAATTIASGKEQVVKWINIRHYNNHLQKLLLGLEGLLKSVFPKFGSAPFRNTIINYKRDISSRSADSVTAGSLVHSILSNISLDDYDESDELLRSENLWRCFGSILGSLDLDTAAVFDSFVQQYGLVEILAMVVDPSHGILSSWKKWMRFAETCLLLLLPPLSKCIRHCALKNQLRDIFFCSGLIAKMSDLALVLTVYIQQQDDVSSSSSSSHLPIADGSVASAQSLPHDHVSTVMQSLSLLWNSFHFFLLHSPTSMAELSCSPATAPKGSSSQRPKEQGKWKDAQSNWVWYIFCSQLVGRTLTYLDTHSVNYLKRRWKFCSSSADAENEPVSFIRVTELSDLRNESSNRGSVGSVDNVDSAVSETREQMTQSLAEYEMCCSAVELMLGVASYLRLSAGVTPSTLVTCHEQLHSRKHKHPRGRNMISMLAQAAAAPAVAVVVSTADDSASTPSAATSNTTEQPPPHPQLQLQSTGNLLNVVLHVLSLLYRVNVSHEQNSSASAVSSETPKQRVQQIWRCQQQQQQQGSSTGSTVLQEAVHTLMTLCLETLCCVAEMDIQLFHQLPKPSKLELLVSLGALLAAAAASSSSSSSSSLSLTDGSSNDSNGVISNSTAGNNQATGTDSLFSKTFSLLGYLYLPITTVASAASAASAADSSSANAAVGLMSSEVSDGEWSADRTLATAHHGLPLYREVVDCLCSQLQDSKRMREAASQVCPAIASLLVSVSAPQDRAALWNYLASTTAAASSKGANNSSRGNQTTVLVCVQTYFSNTYRLFLEKYANVTLAMNKGAANETETAVAAAAAAAGVVGSAEELEEQQRKMIALSHRVPTDLWLQLLA